MRSSRAARWWVWLGCTAAWRSWSSVVWRRYSSRASVSADAAQPVIERRALARRLASIEGDPARVAGRDPLVDAGELLLAVEGGPEVRRGLFDRAALAGAEAQDLTRHRLEVLVGVAEGRARVAEKDQRRRGDRGPDQALEVVLERLRAEH